MILRPRHATFGRASTAILLAALAWATVPDAVADPDQHQGHSQEGVASRPQMSTGSDGPAEMANDSDRGMRCGGGDHAHHTAMLEKRGYQRSEHAYPLPDPRLVDMAGRETTLLKEIDTDRPVMLNFIFTTCPTICPVMSGVFAQVQQQLGPAAMDLKMVSISIDPEYDTPERLRAYAQRFNAGPQWQFLTGKPEDIVAVQKAFDVYRGTKMSHEPTTLLRRSTHDPWIRLDGIASAGELVGEYRGLAGP